METQTRITGRTARTASGLDRNNVHRRWTVGDKTTIIVIVDAADGGHLEGQYTVEIVELGLGTEYGMNGTTGIARLRYVGAVPADFRGERLERDREFVLAIRHLVAGKL